MVLEKNYKELKSELFEQNKLPMDDIEGVSSNSMKFRGTRNLLMAIKNASEMEETRKTIEEQDKIQENEEEQIDIVRMKYKEESSDEQNPENSI